MFLWTDERENGSHLSVQMTYKVLDIAGHIGGRGNNHKAVMLMMKTVKGI